MKRFFGFILNRRVYKVLTIVMVCCWAIFGINVAVKLVYRFGYPVKYKTEVVKASEEFGLDKFLIFSMIKTESGFNEKAVSDKGAIGLMQITEKTGEYIAEKLGATDYDLKNAEDNIYFGCYYVKYLITRFKDLNVALCAYNAGEGNVSLWLLDERYSLDGETLKDVPFKETKEYVDRVNKTLIKYKKLYTNILDK